MRRFFVLGLVLAIATVGCEIVPTDDGDDSAPATGSGEDTGDTLAPQLDIGDVEQGIWLTATLAEKSNISGVTKDEFADPLKRIKLVTINVQGALPDEFWLTIRAEPRREFLSNPVPLDVYQRIEVEYEGQDEPAIIERPAFRVAFDERTGDVYMLDETNIGELVEGDPSTMLYQLYATAVLTKTGTSKDSLDLENFESIEGQRTKILGNPVRINLHQ